MSLQAKMGCQVRNGIYCTRFSSVQSMHLMGTWTQKLCDTSPVQGPVSTSQQWGHHHLHKKTNARYYNGLGFGINVYLRSHIDADFTMSIVQAHMTTTIMSWMIKSYVILHSQELGWLLHFVLVTFFCSIQ